MHAKLIQAILSASSGSWIDTCEWREVRDCRWPQSFKLAFSDRKSPQLWRSVKTWHQKETQNGGSDLKTMTIGQGATHLLNRHSGRMSTTKRTCNKVLLAISDHFNKKRNSNPSISMMQAEDLLSRSYRPSKGLLDSCYGSLWSNCKRCRRKGEGEKVEREIKPSKKY